ncbi:unknown [Crocosphaera subtropica ATCC 51142]|uniref:Transposase n=1 Tax=Crocosphaera subtropica (strain ATCC 51142 / BH68) TaxID=43989 RepID=B1WS61_CROS5|nr:transposase [Crocosphaera subtropica]ACB50255.1 unknown [Crocosphaera subtropica ATCC 51142]
MSPKKLTDDDKQEILNLYRQTPETTSTLADRYGVSSSTISRFLKNTLSDVEYEDLIQQKRLARTNKLQTNPEVDSTPQATKPILKVSEEVPPPEPTTNQTEKPETLSPESTSKPKPVVKKETPVLLSQQEDEETEETEELEEVNVVAVGEMLGEELEDSDEDWDDEEDEDEGEEEEEYNDSLSTPEDVQVLPLSAATFPKTCYLVIDRSAELIAKPLKEFAHLGQIPVDEVQQKTLPIFDNHRVARRFSNRSQRVIKIPDGRLLYKTCDYLQAKGITRILMDGQIYSLATKSD